MRPNELFFMLQRYQELANNKAYTIFVLKNGVIKDVL